TPAALAAVLAGTAERPAGKAAGLAEARLAQTPPPLPRNDPWPLALAKTLGSMLVSVIVYTMVPMGREGLDFCLCFAIGFVVLMLIHELGHSMAMRYFRLSASPPMLL